MSSMVARFSPPFELFSWPDFLLTETREKSKNHFVNEECMQQIRSLWGKKETKTREENGEVNLEVVLHVKES